MKLPQSSTTFLSVLALTFFLGAAVPSLAGQQALSPSSSRLRFGKVAVGSSESQVVDVTNPGTASITVSSVSVSGAEFSVSGVNLPVAIGPGETIPLSITFRPAVSGWMGEQITLSDTSSTPVLQITSAGTGVNSLGLTTSPSNLSFGSVSLGSTVALPVVLTNSRSWNQTIDSFQVNGSGFSISAPAAPLVLAGGQSVTVNISFSPLSSGLIGGSVFVAGPNINVPLVGTGVTSVVGKLIVSPTSLNFGNVNVGSSTTQPSSVSATGGSVTISAETNNNPQFQMTGISLPVTIPAGQTLAFDVVFAPTQSGSTSGSLAFASNASNALSTEAVSGSGVATQKSVNLSWNASSSSVAGYNVYRGSSIGAYSKINSSMDPSTTYTDSTIASGATYYYAATAVNSTGQESAYSAAIKVAVP